MHLLISVNSEHLQNKIVQIEERSAQFITLEKAIKKHGLYVLGLNYKELSLVCTQAHKIFEKTHGIRNDDKKLTPSQQNTFENISDLTVGGAILTGLISAIVWAYFPGNFSGHVAAPLIIILLGILIYLHKKRVYNRILLRVAIAKALEK